MAVEGAATGSQLGQLAYSLDTLLSNTQPSAPKVARLPATPASVAFVKPATITPCASVPPPQFERACAPPLPSGSQSWPSQRVRLKLYKSEGNLFGITLPAIVSAGDRRWQ